MTEVQTQNEQPESQTIVRTLVVQTDGDNANVIRNEMYRLELRSVLQMMLAQVDRGNSLVPGPQPQAPDGELVEPEPAEEAAEEQENG